MMFFFYLHSSAVIYLLSSPNLCVSVVVCVDTCLAVMTLNNFVYFPNGCAFIILGKKDGNKNSLINSIFIHLFVVRVGELTPKGCLGCSVLALTLLVFALHFLKILVEV